MRFYPILIVLLLAGWVAAQPLPPSKWLEDVKYFGSQLPKRHMNAFHHVSKEEFDRDVAQLLKDVPTLKEHQIIVRLLQITAKVGDGHTYVHFPTNFKRYPILLNWFGEELRVVATTPEYTQALGARITAIDNHQIEDIRQKISTVVSQAENKYFWLITSSIYLGIPEIVHTVGIANSYEQANFTLLDSSNREVKLTLPTVTVDPNRKWIPVSKTVPLFRQQLTNPFWFTFIGDLKAVYVNFKKYDHLNKDADALFDFVKASKAERLIIDLRQNGGGDYFEGRKHLIKPIKSNPILNQKGHLFVITGRRTFSAAMVNSIDFGKDTEAVIVGEPPGEVPNSYSENDEMKLPNSKLVLSYSTRYYKFLEQDALWFEPDQLIELSWKEWAEGRDPVMDWIYQYCKMPSN